ncbi:hypothetical protein [Sulfitobacter sp. R18_1]|uniref:hypothetical protein n=1 Tax=Sulfitobacter sp. R18_1 TaxID=2821104 RepID=UPI001ADAF1D1|nr:hypothetical protein [Sulfitobacter sp. R18_1]MBO9428059.1 hypothetical protein [Sulfitobacter sp. R18_1]
MTTSKISKDELEASSTRSETSIVGDAEVVAKAIYEQECADDPHPEACPRWEDFPDHHAPYLRKARAAMAASGLGERVSRAYSERAAAAVAMARFALMSGYNAGVGRDSNEDWDDEWRVVLYVDTPGGQVSWHISPDDQHFLEGLPNYEGDWDGTFLSRDGSFLKWDQDKTDA